jgi:hypothetical protein
MYSAYFIDWFYTRRANTCSHGWIDGIYNKKKYKKYVCKLFVLVAASSENLSVSIFTARLEKLRCLKNSLIGGCPL